jgi:chromosomal replication initiator protein
MPPTSPRYTFQTFVVSSNNRLAHAACVAAAEKPGTAHNPVFIYGGVGLGKTHLLHAVGHAALERGHRVIYATSETFTNDFIECISRGRMEDFRTKYRQTDVLLIDDIHFIAGKEQTQEEFFHTFNTVHEAGGQLVISSDRHPRHIATLEDRLRSRFVWGLMADIQEPDLETRIAILRAKLTHSPDLDRLDVPAEVLELLAISIPSNIRELEGALNRVIAYAELADSPITVAVATAALNPVLESLASRSLSPTRVIDAVCRSAGVSRAEVEGRHRDRRVVLPRQIAMYLLREMTGLSFAEIGSLLGRDHTTVLHSCEKIATEIQRDHRVRSGVNAARELLARQN